ncbi:hypothetical protein [Mycobacterium shigaense]|uniref:hypothetical protein n=1 Tax=Mycobacterium shigaense TaxID=722731 RepID=UPI002ADF7C15|nr:hypothetical protein [Mycobacterium shigaense]MEA1120666.1 hypothetical protein [Mycobacterium shigaense]
MSAEAVWREATWGALMSAKHRMWEPSTDCVEGRRMSGVTGACDLLCRSGLCAAALIALVTYGVQPTKRTVAASQEPMPASQPVSQEGAVIAVGDGSVTARSANGYTQTYLITPSTTFITHAGGHSVPATTYFTVNDPVVIIGTIRGGRVLAITVAGGCAGQGGGPQMDYADGQAISSAIG